MFSPGSPCRWQSWSSEGPWLRPASSPREQIAFQYSSLVQLQRAGRHRGRCCLCSLCWTWKKHEQISVSWIIYTTILIYTRSIRWLKRPVQWLALTHSHLRSPQKREQGPSLKQSCTLKAIPYTVFLTDSFSDQSLRLHDGINPISAEARFLYPWGVNCSISKYMALTNPDLVRKHVIPRYDRWRCFHYS